ncbi:hypothetical protein [Actinophytocola glycyrrhizae]|uniref:Uncharacterized protein n=1 Tax=Actinophytocola glycyrrhizae TaxID=2044873 RepID=A0ABV9SFT1_9PSEU
MRNYTEATPLGPSPSGDVAGAAQLSTAWGRRFTADLGDGRWDVCDVDVFVVNADHHADHNEASKPPRPVIKLRVAHTLCTDPTDPTGTELDTAPVDSRVLPGDDATDDLAHAWCAAFDSATVDVPSWHRNLP